jgi:hypothetical protein
LKITHEGRSAVGAGYSQRTTCELELYAAG